MGRGLLIVFEGCDRCGKSTQAKQLLDKFLSKNVPAELWRFPDRTTRIGILIDEYLSKKTELDDKAAHLLFSANRWEKHPEMLRKLADGVNLIVDRYTFSGVAFTAAKGLDAAWCAVPDRGLSAPDLLIHMELPSGEAEGRGGFGGERYEVSEFQAKVKEQYAHLYSSLESVKPAVLNVSGLSVDDVGAIVDSLVSTAFLNVPSQINALW